MATAPTPFLAAVAAYVDDHRQAFLDELCDLVRQPSISSEDVGVEACADHLVATMRRSGLSARLLATRNKPVVYGERLVATDRPTVLVYGHYDVQPVDPLDAWDSPPFEPIVRHGRLYGRGTSDNKGQHLAQLLGIRATLAVAGELPVNVKVVLEGEEECSSPHLAEFVEGNRELLAADVVYTSDGPVHDSGEPTVVLGVRGILCLELRARGARSDLHSGNRGGVVPNPAWELVRLLATMVDAEGTVTVDGFGEGVTPPTDAERAAIERLPVDVDAHLRTYGIDRLPPPEGLGFYDRLMLRPTLNIAGLASGSTGEGFKTIVPATAMARIDVRLVPDQDPDGVFAAVAAHVAARAPGVEVTRVGAMPPSRTPVDNPYTQAVVGALTDVWGREPLVLPSLGGTLPDYVFTRLLGLPSLLVPYANADQANHAPNENLELERFYTGIRTCAAVLQRIAAVR
ncbi:MAG: M20/M25/M40 family metallo-hydrolase [Euzebyales bacterium]|nr:M20/M25/M40 family metallo-hydrolase [Euzebyales bacterium]